MNEPLTDRDIILALARFEGWVDFWEEVQDGQFRASGMKPGYYGLMDTRTPLPDYLNDLNAMHVIEAKLHDLENGAAWHAYLMTLDGGHGAQYGHIDAVWYVVTATARQRAQAAYKAIQGIQAVKINVGAAMVNVEKDTAGMHSALHTLAVLDNLRNILAEQQMHINKLEQRMDNEIAYRNGAG